MLNLWVKLIKDNKLIDQHLSPVTMTDTQQILQEGLNQACYKLDLARPIIQQKHIDDMAQYGFTRFLPESFMEEVGFDKMEVRIYDDSPKKKNKPRYYE